MRLELALITACFCCTVGTSARAAPAIPPCGLTSRDVALSFEGSFGEDEDRQRIRKWLAAELDAKDLVLCDPDGTVEAPVLATIRVAATPERAEVRIRIEDAVTVKEVGRVIPLEDVPDDGRALTVAIAADELLRATWAELAMRDVQKPEREVPPEVRAVVQESMAEPERRRGPIQVGAKLLGALANLAHSGGGVALLVHYYAAEHFALRAELGSRAYLPVSSAHGEVTTRSLTGAVGALVPLAARKRRAGLDILGRIGWSAVAFRAEATDSGRAQDARSWVLDVSGGLVVWLRISPRFQLGTELVVTLPVRGAEARDEEQPVVAFSEPGAELGLELRWGI